MVYALDGASGQVLWSARREHDSAASTPVISADGKAYLGSTGDMQLPGVVYVIDLSSGQMSPWFRVEGKYNSSPTIAADGTIYAGDWGLYALAPSDARQIGSRTKAEEPPPCHRRGWHGVLRDGRQHTRFFMMILFSGLDEKRRSFFCAAPAVGA